MRSWTAVPEADHRERQPGAGDADSNQDRPDGGDQEERVAGAEERMPSATVRASPMRRITADAATAPAIAPTPCPALRTPRNAGGLWMPCWRTAKIAVSANPTTSSAAATVEHDPAQARPVGDVRDPGDELGQDVVLGRDRPRLAQAERPQAHGRGEERRGVERRDRRAADGREEAGADERGDQRRALARGL